MENLVLTRESMDRAAEELSSRDADLRRAFEQVGRPSYRRKPQTFASLLRIVAGQQLSTKAAGTIFARLASATGGAKSPQGLLRLSSDQLRELGLSRRKAEYCQGLAAALESGQLSLPALRHKSDEQVIASISALRGFGRWSAEMYLIFSLGRPDIWPRDDLGVQTAIARIKGLPDRPRRADFDALGESWRPYRSVVALLCWRYLHNAPV